MAAQTITQARAASVAPHDVPAASEKGRQRVSTEAQRTLRVYSEQMKMSVEQGDLLLINGSWYVTHSGLLRLAQRRRCCAIHVQPEVAFCDPANSRWVFKAIVYTSRSCRGFVGFGDADPSNTSAAVRGAEMRVAETRAVNRALRKAYGIGICSFEEITGPAANPRPRLPRNGDGKNSSPSLRDRLLLLIRQHGLDGEQVKRYALNFCGTRALRNATREQVEALVTHLTELATQGREKLVEQLAPYAAAAAEEGRAKKEAA